MWQNFFSENPYDHFPLDQFECDIQGWGIHPYFQQVLEIVRPKLIIEVGTWKGFSALYMAHLLETMGIQAHIICVDTWLGAPEFFFDREPMTQIKRRHGYPKLYEQFIANVIYQNRQKVITPLPQTSDGAFELLGKLQLIADVVYLDGAHDFDTVSRDLKNYWSLLRPGGVLFGDDYVRDGVRDAVGAFSASSDIPVHHHDGKYLLHKSPFVFHSLTR